MTRPASIAAAVPHASASLLRLNPQLATAAKSKQAAGGISKPALRQDRSGMNKTEADFLAHLKATTPREIEIHREGLGMRIGNGCVYWPDFITSDAHFDMVCAYEIKGFMRDDAAVKIKAAAAKFRTFKFFLVFRDKSQASGWRIEEVMP